MPRLTRRPRSPRRALPTALLVCGLAIPALAGCEAGLNAPTLEFHPAAGGAQHSADGIMISNAFVLGPAIGQSLPAGGRAGVFLAIVSTNGDTLESVSATGAAASVTLTGGPVSVAPGEGADLVGPDPRIVLTDLSKPLMGGETVTLELTFANAGEIDVQAPVEPHAYDYATYAQPPAPAPTPSATATAIATGAAKVKKKAKASASATASASASATASPSPTP